MIIIGKWYRSSLISVKLLCNCVKSIWIGQIGDEMNIIFISMELPYPANSGGRIYTWERLKQIQKHSNNIFLYTLAENSEKVELEKIKEVCSEVNIYRRENKYKNAILNLFKPYSVVSRYNKNMYYDIEKIIASEKKVDLIIIDIPEMILNCPVNNNIPKIITQHNIEFKVFQSIYKNSKNYIHKAIFYIEYIKMKRFEDKIYKSNLINGFTFISEKDAEVFQNMYNIKRYNITPQGYDVDFNNEKKITINDGCKIILFTGKMNYQPNVQAVEWFCTNIFPHIKEKVKNLKFYIVGKKPTDEVKKLANDDIIVTGEVESVEPYIHKADLVVIPLKSGGGVKIKLFEALGNGKIVVTTSKGIEGTKFKDKIHVILANDEEGFINQCSKILSNPADYSILVKNSLMLMKQNYSWDAIGEDYNKFLINVKNSTDL
ncbi:glycosyltransferase [Clostridium pasteurianum]|nr:glycosyltransferase [Clostridium pasteurianum]